MKKLFLTSVVLLMAVMAQAQTKITPKLQKGFKAVYTEVATNNAGGTEQKVTSETEYVVSDVTADGAVIDITMTSIDAGQADNGPMGKLMSLSESVMKGVCIKVRTDAEGQVKGVVNLDEVKAKVIQLAGSIVDEIMKESPEVSQALPKDVLMSQFSEQLTEESLIASLTNSGVLALNGKTVRNGATESVNNEQGMKLKRMYFVVGKNIITNSTLDMTKDELKEFVLKQVEKVAPDQAEMVKQNIDAVMGQMSFNVTSKSTYEMQDNGWVKSIKTEASQDSMGQSVKQTSEITLKQ